MGETTKSRTIPQRWHLPRTVIGVALLLALAAGSPGPVQAGDMKRNTSADCKVSDGRGFVKYSSSKYLGEVAGTRKYAQWVFAKDGVRMGDRIKVSWTPSAPPESKLQAAIDGPVAKSAKLVAVLKNKVIGLASSSSSLTTRTWLITVDFKEETVTAMASSAGSMAVKAQLMTLDCQFKTRTAEAVSE